MVRRAAKQLGDEFVESLEGAIDVVVTFPDALPEIAAGHRRALAIALYLESLEDHGDPVPPPITEEIKEIAKDTLRSILRHTGLTPGELLRLL